MIVRRNRPAVGGRRARMIVRRGRGVEPGGQPPGGGRGWRPGLPRIPRRWVWGAIAGLSVLAILTTGTWIYRSPLFEIEHIEVEGNQRVSNVAVVDAAELFGASMFTADLGSAQGRLYAIPLVNAVRV
ncbi:MAG: FtsQ-type POTRA domain-containing protein, partial [Dehalococcoidia bacterium]